MGGLDNLKQAFHIILVAKYEFSGNCGILRKLMPKDVPKTTNIDHIGGSGSDFYDIGAF